MLLDSYERNDDGWVGWPAGRLDEEDEKLPSFVSCFFFPLLNHMSFREEAAKGLC